MRNKDKVAFPTAETTAPVCHGLTKREYAAIALLPYFLAKAKSGSDSIFLAINDTVTTAERLMHALEERVGA